MLYYRDREGTEKRQPNGNLNFHILHCKLHFQHWFRLLTLCPSHPLSNFNLSQRSVCCWSKVWFYLNMHGIMQWLSMGQKEQESEGGEGLCGGEDGMRCWGMCTHSEVLLQRVSILLLQVEGREEGRGCNSNGNKECTQGQWDTGIHQHATE